MASEFQFHFEWDPPKAAANLRKHGVSFERAATVFQDPEALSLYDRAHSAAGEDRWITLGMDAHGQLLVASHTWREAGEGTTRCRIISARKATKTEARQYRAR
ncbi:MAG: BrnT family toxin [Verrucomicrobia bacterium]|nr:BrnT family toxin [Verrucomicrobiota bacterium]